ncbi:transport-associated protein [Pandoraea capi]|uniref:Transport-associated protein n=1 Tax=Pandoraea capi TaxID=2508286 RepID=A0ABY6VSD9_9BURK|nr:BON domain-containing protein [Pandoraea capi]VVD75229.1 transport-associated protein [Pandoraea capi]
MAKRIPPSPTLPATRRAAPDKAKYASEHQQHALTHEDGDAETSGVPASATQASDDTGKAQTHEAKQSSEREAQAARAHDQRDPKWLGASAPKGRATAGSRTDSTGDAGGHGYAPEIAHGEESGYGPADAAPGAHPRFGRQSAYGPHDDYAGTGRNASDAVPQPKSPSKARRVEWPEGTVGAQEIENVDDIAGEAGLASGSRGRSSEGGSVGSRERGHASAGAEGQSRGTTKVSVQARSRDSSRSDPAIHDDIRKTLSAAVDLDVSHVEVTVTSGLVLLTGFVPERWMQHVVQTEVSKVEGVLGVDNRLHERRIKAMSRPGESQTGHKI